MGLREQFTLNYPIETSKEAEKYSKECVKIAENFAIGFFDWLMENCNLSDDKSLWSYESEDYTNDKLLEIYKKTL